MTARRRVLTDGLRPGSANGSELGGKGDGLVRLRALGLPVPRFLVVTRSAFDEAVGRSPWLEAALADLDGARPKALVAASRRIARHIRAVGCPADLREELHAALAEQGLLEVRLAVRSSAIGEDSERHSFAGLMETRLNVAERDVPAALVDVWASAFSTRALAYRRRKGLRRRIETAVIVQEMVPAVSAGVLFTRDPEAPAGTGHEGTDTGAVIVAAWGLGEGVVQGTVETDTYRPGGSVTGQVTTKASRVVPDDAGGTRTENLPESLRGRAVLTGDQVRCLAEVGAAVEGATGTPQDLEWAFDGEGRLFVLQSRPVAPPEPARARGEHRLWDNSNIVESYPGLTLPLTFSFVRHAYAQAFRRACAAFFPLGNPLEKQPHLFEGLLGLLDGRVYYNLLNWYEMFSYLARPEQHRMTWDRMVGVSPAAAPPSVPEGARPLLVRAMAALGALRVLLGVRRIGRRFTTSFDAFYRRHRDADRASSPADLAVRYRRIEGEAARFWHLTLFTDLCAMRYQEWVAALAARWMPGHGDLANRLLATEQGVESVGPARSLAALVSRVRNEPRWRERFARQDDAELWRSLQAEASLGPLRAAVEAHVEAFGDRGIEELKLETVTFREEPERLLGLIRRSLDCGPSVEGRRESQRERRRETEALVARSLRGARRAAFQVVLKRAREAIANRENMRFARSRLFGIVRGIFRRLGEQLASAGVLDEAGDVFYLTTDEVLGCVEGTGVTHDLGALVVLRRAEYTEFARRQPADRLETDGLPGVAPLKSIERPTGRESRLQGIGCSAGIVTGAAHVVRDPNADSVSGDQVLVARSTDPGWVFLMMSAAGLVAERGSPLSHTAIIGRELGIPTVVGAEGATTRIPDGARLTIDGTTGGVQWA